MNKPLLIDSIYHVLQENVESLLASSRKTRLSGNDPQSQSEGKYDTRSTEENYLADGFARQAQAATETLAAFKGMTLKNFTATSPIDSTALVQLQIDQDTAWFFLAPVAGGTEVHVENMVVTVLSLDSPLGSQLIGLKAGQHTQSPAAKVLSVQ